MLSCMLPLRYGLKLAAKVMMHQRMQQGREEALVLIAASELTKAEWEDEHEFRLNGQMYDVAGIEYHDGQKHYRCVADERETRIEHRLDDGRCHLAGGEPNERQSGIVRLLQEWLQGLYTHWVPQFQQAYALLQPDLRFIAASASALQDPLLHPMIIPPEACA